MQPMKGMNVSPGKHLMYYHRFKRVSHLLVPTKTISVTKDGKQIACQSHPNH